MESGSVASRLTDFQRNVAFAAFILIVVFACFIFLIESLANVLVPLVWSAFFAVPLTALISHINQWLVRGGSKIIWLLRSDPIREGTEPVKFKAATGENCLVLEKTRAAEAMIEQLRQPCIGCWGSCICDCIYGSRSIALYFCQSRVRITSLECRGAPCDGEEVNRFVAHWAYYPGEQGTESTDSADEVTLKLFLDRELKYPAVLPSETSSSKKPQGKGDMDLAGTLELDKTSALSWGVSVMIAMSIMVAAVYLFVASIVEGLQSFKHHMDSYQKGLQDFLDFVSKTAKHFLPNDTWKDMQQQSQEFATSALPDVASALATQFEHLGSECTLFLIYLFFWIFEPLPVDNSVAQVVKNYLLLKTCVCLIFAALMAGLLKFLQCPLWSLFFVVTFLLNYIPEVGAIASFLLMIPAMLFDGNLDPERRRRNTALLILFGIIFKIITGNIIEVQMYATKGGEHMRLHPVILMALMMLCAELLGISGMFLAIPIVAGMKYYAVSTDLPSDYLNPLLVFLEGDETGPHKNFVDKKLAAGYGAAETQDDGASRASEQNTAETV